LFVGAAFFFGEAMNEVETVNFVLFSIVSCKAKQSKQNKTKPNQTKPNPTLIELVAVVMRVNSEAATVAHYERDG
jgi:hypothetical protein